MGERQVEKHHVARLGQAVLHLVALAHHRVVVAVADHARLRRAGRARRVDEREEVVLVDRVGALVERGRVRRRVRAAALAQLVEVGERDDVSARTRVDLRALLLVLDERRRPPPSARGRTARRAASCSRRSARRPRRRARARSRTAPTRGSSARGSRTARPCGRRARAGRSRARRPPRPPRPARPRAIRRRPRCEVGADPGWPAATASRHRFAIVRGSGPLAPTSRRRRNWADARRIHAVPLEFPAHADNLERLSQLRSRQHPRRPRAGDEAGRPPVGRLVPDAAPRVRHADQAEALVPGPRARRRVRTSSFAAGRSQRAQFVMVEDAELEAIEQRDTSRSIEISRFVQLEPRSIPSTSTAPTTSCRRAPRRSGARTCCSTRR